MPFQFLRVNVSKYQNSRSRRQVIDFIIFCLNKAYGKLFSKNALKGSAALSFFKIEGSLKHAISPLDRGSGHHFLIENDAFSLHSYIKNEIVSIRMLWTYYKTIIQYSKTRYRFEKYVTEITF